MDVRNSFKEPAGYLKTWDEENLMYGNVITALPVWSLCPARPSQEVSPVRSIPLACKNTIKKGRTRQHSLVSIEFKGFGWSAISNPIWLRELRLTKSIDASGFIMCNAWYCQVVSSKNRDAWIPAGVYPILLIQGRNDTFLWKPQCTDRHLIVLGALFPLTAWKLKDKYCINK